MGNVQMDDALVTKTSFCNLGSITTRKETLMQNDHERVDARPIINSHIDVSIKVTLVTHTTHVLSLSECLSSDASRTLCFRIEIMGIAFI